MLEQPRHQNVEGRSEEAKTVHTISRKRIVSPIGVTFNQEAYPEYSDLISCACWSLNTALVLQAGALHIEAKLKSEMHIEFNFQLDIPQ